MAKFEKGNNFGNRFQKGQSGNEKGRPKKALLSDALRRKMSEKLRGKSERTIADAIADALIKKAKSGDVQAIKEVFDRTEGKVSQKIDADIGIYDWQSAIVNFGISPEMILQEAAKLLTDGDDGNIEHIEPDSE